MFEEKENSETTINEEDKLQKQADIDTHLLHPIYSFTSSKYSLLEQTSQDLSEKELNDGPQHIFLPKKRHKRL